MKLIFAFVVMLLSPYTFAQTKDVKFHSSTVLSNQARYEIVQSTLAARFTFKVDKVCGNIFQLVLNKNDDPVWEQMSVIKLPGCNNDGRVKYQLFLSGIAARHTFLMNTDTGKTWQVRSFTNQSGGEAASWFPLDD
jgi:hypothetical protein